MFGWSDYGDFDRPYASLEELRRDMDRLFGDWERGNTRRAGFAGNMPRAALSDEGDTLVIRTEVPGLTEKDLDIQLQNSTITLRGKREVDSPKGYAVHRRERGNIEFARSFSLPYKVQADSAKATLKNGILTLTMDKSPEARPRQITIQAQ